MADCLHLAAPGPRDRRPPAAAALEESASCSPRPGRGKGRRRPHAPPPPPPRPRPPPPAPPLPPQPSSSGPRRSWAPWRFPETLRLGSSAPLVQPPGRSGESRGGAPELTPLVCGPRGQALLSRGAAASHAGSGPRRTEAERAAAREVGPAVTPRRARQEGGVALWSPAPAFLSVQRPPTRTRLLLLPLLPAPLSYIPQAGPEVEHLRPGVASKG